MENDLILALQDENKKLKVQLNSSLRSNQDLNAKCSQLRHLLESTESEMQELFERINQQTNRIPTLKQTCKELEIKLAESRARNELLQTEAVSARKERDETSAAAALSHQELERVTEKFAQEVQTLGAEKINLEHCNKSLKTQIEEHQKLFASTTSQLQAKLDEKDSQIESLSLELESQAKRLRQTPAVQQALERERDERARMEEQLLSQQTRVSQLEQSLKDERYSFEKKLSIAKLEHSKELKSLQLDYDRQIRLLNNRLWKYDQTQYATRPNVSKQTTPQHSLKSKNNLLNSSKAQTLMTTFVEKLKQTSASNSKLVAEGSSVTLDDNSQAWLRSLHSALKIPENSVTFEIAPLSSAAPLIHSDQPSNLNADAFIKDLEKNEQSILEKFSEEIEKLENEMKSV